MIRINLLPVREKRKKESTRLTLSIFCLILLASAVAVGIFHWNLAVEIGEVDRQIVTYGAEIKQLQIDTKDVEKFKAEKEDLQRRLNIIYALQQAKTGPVRVLDELVIANPGKVWLTSLKEKNGKMEVKGVAFDNQDIARFMTHLERSGAIRNVELVVAQQIERKDLKLKEFTVTCQVNYASVPASGSPAPAAQAAGSPGGPKP
ncbi:MAG TPA: PilN domain-containing protein [Thermodesulfobacteriota bacterium]|nr:PilN domain-containing protein [Thermodesulfobacteriota bacterium]